MTPIPGEGHGKKPFSMTTKDGRKVTLRVAGLEGPPQVHGAVQRERDEEQPEGRKPAAPEDDGA